MKFKDYYRVLGIASEANADEIKSAYRKLARTHHPDVSKAADAQQRFSEVGEAYEALSDPKKRAAYDDLRRAGFREGQEMDAPPPGSASGGFGGYGRRSANGASGAGSAGGAGGDGGYTEMDPGDFSDFFQSLFGGAAGGGGGGAGRRGGGTRRSAFHERGEDVHHALAISVLEAYRGGERQIQMQVPEVDAHGQVVPKVRTLTVKIPAGVTHGEKIRLRGQGMPGSSPENAGDLYLEILLDPHPLFHVDGRDVRIELPVAPWEAVLGASVRAPTLGGVVNVTIPAGTRAGDKLRLRGLGLPGKQPGDQIVAVVIAVPATASEPAKELYRQLAKESAFDPREQHGV